MALTKVIPALIDGGVGTDWQTAIQTSNFTAAAGKGYFVNTTSAEITITLPVGIVGDEVVVQDYIGTFATNNVILNANGSEKIQGSSLNALIDTNNATALLIYQDTTQGWTSQDINLLSQVSFDSPTGQSLTYTTPSPQSSQGGIGETYTTTTFTVTSSGNILSGTASVAGLPSGITITSQTFDDTLVDNFLTITLGGIYPTVSSLNTVLTISGLTITPPITADFLVIAGGGGGGNDNGGGGGGAGGLRTSYGTTSGGGATAESSITLETGTTYTTTIGGGGTGGTASPYASTSGSSSSIVGGLISVVSTGGGRGSGSSGAAEVGGSGGGGKRSGLNGFAGAAATSSPVQGYAGATGGGGGGAGGVGTPQDETANWNGAGPGLAVSISGSSVTYALGGNGTPSYQDMPAGGAASGGANTGTGGDANGRGGTTAGSGGSGLIVLRLPTSSFNSGGLSGGSTSVDGSDTIITFSGSGTYTA